MWPPRLPQLCKWNLRHNKTQVSVYLLKPENRAKQPVAGKPGAMSPEEGHPGGSWRDRQRVGPGTCRASPKWPRLQHC